MSETTTGPLKHDDLGMLYRRQHLEDHHGIRFQQQPRANGDTTPRYPLRWTATWKAASGDRVTSEPMPMPDLIPHVEQKLGVRRGTAQ
jgi:hypothetical protein